MKAMLMKNTIIETKPLGFSFSGCLWLTASSFTIFFSPPYFVFKVFWNYPENKESLIFLAFALYYIKIILSRTKEPPAKYWGLLRKESISKSLLL
jgi:hypothetical protein